MSEEKRSTSRVRRPFFWRRKKAKVQDPVKRVPDYEADQRQKHPWYRPTFLKVCAALLVGLVLIPTTAHGQFGIDTAAILAALSKVPSRSIV